MSEHPYRGLPDHQFWNRAVTWAPPGGLDPVVHTRFTIGPQDKIATMGSCFAQHLARHLAASGLGYLITEAAPAGLSPAAAAERQYGTYTARYGNVYTVVQAVQLLDRAFGRFVPTEQVWARPDGAVVDPFRPTIEPSGFATEAELEADRERHLAAVRQMVTEADVLVFTLGLTEGWRHRGDGSVYPVAPGVSGGSWDPAVYEFVNFDVASVQKDLVALCDRLRELNPRLQVLLTVSPVPLIATYEDRHVLVSTTLSKAVLRVAADHAVAQRDFVDYFPSYELVASATTPRQAYGPDLREVDELAVAHVMRVFTKHYVERRDWSASGGAGSPVAPAAEEAAPVICDEDVVAAAIEASSGPSDGASGGAR